MGTDDHNDITEVLTASQAMTRVQPLIPEAPIEEVAMPTGTTTLLRCIPVLFRLPL